MIAPNDDLSNVTVFSPEDAARIGATAIGSTNELTAKFVFTQLENAAVFDSELEGLDPRTLAAFGTFGAIVRANDLFAQLQALFKQRRRPRVQSSIINVMRNISNIMNIAIMLEKKQWPL